ncbi:MAG: hypothetical protein P8J29_06945, partial [Rhodospirillales bacterium]|nr:hypothetical protein [Rhodospirillales bacterium]
EDDVMPAASAVATVKANVLRQAVVNGARRLSLRLQGKIPPDYKAPDLFPNKSQNNNFQSTD